jgi:hypothetical protein
MIRFSTTDGSLLQKIAALQQNGDDAAAERSTGDVSEQPTKRNLDRALDPRHTGACRTIVDVSVPHLRGMAFDSLDFFFSSGET